MTTSRFLGPIWSPALTRTSPIVPSSPHASPSPSHSVNSEETVADRNFLPVCHGNSRTPASARRHAPRVRVHSGDVTAIPVLNCNQRSTTESRPSANGPIKTSSLSLPRISKWSMYGFLKLRIRKNGPSGSNQRKRTAHRVATWVRRTSV